MFLIYPIGIPAFFAWCLWDAKKSLNPSPETVANALLVRKQKHEKDGRLKRAWTLSKNATGAFGGRSKTPQTSSSMSSSSSEETYQLTLDRIKKEFNEHLELNKLIVRDDDLKAARLKFLVANYEPDWYVIKTRMI